MSWDSTSDEAQQLKDQIHKEIGPLLEKYYHDTVLDLYELQFRAYCLMEAMEGGYRPAKAIYTNTSRRIYDREAQQQNPQHP